MKTALAVLVLLLTAAPAAPQGPLKTVREVDLSRYVGLWHEVAKIPNRFQKQCVSGTTAEYILRADGHIDVLNSCTEADGDRDVAEGLARIVDTVGNTRLEVSFVSFLGWRPFWGDYWIIGLDPDYRWAVVGDPDRKYGWVLSRTPVLDEPDLRAAFTVLRDNGYDPDDFEMSPP